MRNKILVHVGVLAAIITFACAAIGVVAIFSIGFLQQNTLLVLTHAGYLVFCAYLAWLVLKKPSGALLESPKIKKILPGNIVLVEYVPWLGLDVMTAVYILEADYEVLICVGKVHNVQSNGYVQILMKADARGVADLAEAMDLLSKAEPSTILIKPGLYRG